MVESISTGGGKIEARYGFDPSLLPCPFSTFTLPSRTCDKLVIVIISITFLHGRGKNVWKTYATRATQPVRAIDRRANYRQRMPPIIAMQRVAPTRTGNCSW